MIDYFSHVSALRACLNSITSSKPADPAQPKAVSNALAAAQKEPGGAILGALVDHLLQYSDAKTSVEIGLLVKAAALFKKAVAIFNTISVTRSSLEAGLTTPTDPAVLAPYNQALAALPVIGTNIQNLLASLKSFQASFSGDWMNPVGQQQGTPVTQWVWRDVFLARRTTAFVASAQALATTTRQQAFAIGTLAGAAGNLLGSAYVNSVVGGPRRSHQLRHRLAAYSVGAWLRDNDPQYAGSLATIRSAITFGQQGTPTLPTDIKSLAHGALQKAYPSGTAALPDLDLGYKNLLEHLQLLQEFTLPPVTQPMNNTLMTEILGLNIGLGVDNTNPHGSGIGTNYPGIGTHESAGAVCETLLIWFFYPPAWWEAAANALGPGGGPDPTPEDPLGDDEDQLVVASKSPAALNAINNLYAMQMSFWQGLSAARTALVLRGLLYPNPDDLTNPTFAQFLTIPHGTLKYPLLPMPATDDGTNAPTTTVELPATSPSPYAAASTPLAFLTGDPGHSVSALSPALWVAMIENPGSEVVLRNPIALLPNYSGNFNLDADRGFLALCWTLAAGTQITSQPLQITNLGFNEI
jgi:hypothetical protein